MRFAAPLAFAVAAVLSLVACSKPKAGDACASNQATCLDTRTELQCDKGKLVAAPCKGAKGCMVANDVQTCDVSGNAAGDSCSTDDEEVSACLADNKSRIVCKSGKYVVERCRGPKGCKEAGDKVECDASLAAEGDECTKDEQGKLLCAVDKQSVLQCNAGKLTLAETCRGPSGCTPGKQRPCDRGTPLEGDLCMLEGDLECGGTDKKALVVCTSKKWVLKERCRNACVGTPSHADCDRTTPLAGDPCQKQGELVCSGDKKVLLACNGATWAQSAECHGGCTTTPDGRPRCGK